MGLLTGAGAAVGIGVGSIVVVSVSSVEWHSTSYAVQ